MLDGMAAAAVFFLLLVGVPPTGEEGEAFFLFRLDLRLDTTALLL